MLVLPGGAVAASGQKVSAAELFQAGRKLIFTFRTRKPVPLPLLQPRPDARRASARYLCLAFGEMTRKGLERRLCIGGRKGHRRVGMELTDDKHRPVFLDAVRATVKRPNPYKLVVAFDPAEAGMRPDRYGWRVLWSEGCQERRRCAATLPAGGRRLFRLRAVRVVGCTASSSALATHGPRERRVVALTFDDGPSEYTPGFLDILRAKDVDGTFFQVGQEMRGHEDVMRRILAEGSELADHTMNHVEFPGYDQIAGATSLIRSYTHFRPCLFRPPGGAVDAEVIATADSLGMQTINWDVDSNDWQTPGAAAIHKRIVSVTQPGSIILMHDGGGPRSDTLEALPRIIDTLRARGYGFATVSELLGNRLTYRPYG